MKLLVVVACVLPSAPLTTYRAAKDFPGWVQQHIEAMKGTELR